MAINWKEWDPGLDNDSLTLREVHATLPGAKQNEISKIVRFFENPASPFAFKGAVTIERHDYIHILLGRGLLSQDEAFVIGFTMGTAENISNFEKNLFKLIASYLYPKNYKLSENDLKVYELAFKLGKESGIREIYEFPFENYLDRKLSEIRALAGISKSKLYKAYGQEAILLPDTKSSKRLPKPRQSDISI